MQVLGPGVPFLTCCALMTQAMHSLQRAALSSRFVDVLQACLPEDGDRTHVWGNGSHLTALLQGCFLGPPVGCSLIHWSVFSGGSSCMLGLLLCCNLLSCYVVSLDLCKGAGNRRCSLSAHLHGSLIFMELVICCVLHAEGVHSRRYMGTLPPGNVVAARDDARYHRNM